MRALCRAGRGVTLGTAAAAGAVECSRGRRRTSQHLSPSGAARPSAPSLASPQLPPPEAAPWTPCGFLRLTPPLCPFTVPEPHRPSQAPAPPMWSGASPSGLGGNSHFHDRASFEEGSVNTDEDGDKRGDAGDAASGEDRSLENVLFTCTVGHKRSGVRYVSHGRLPSRLRSVSHDHLTHCAALSPHICRRSTTSTTRRRWRPCWSSWRSSWTGR